MFTRIQVKGLRALRYVDVTTGPVQVLVGPNASGKSTFLDAALLARDLVRSGPEAAILGDPERDLAPRALDPIDLSWQKSGEPIEIALTAEIPADLQERIGKAYRWCRYEFSIEVKDEIRIGTENFWICGNGVQKDGSTQGSLFPKPLEAAESLVLAPGKQAPTGWRKTVSKVAGSGNDYFRSETSDWNNQFRLGPSKSALGNLPEDEKKFPIATWFKRTLGEWIQRLMLDAESLRLPARPGLPSVYRSDGTNLPWVVRNLEKTDPETMRDWVEHVRTALGDLEGITTVERPEDRHCYLVLRYSSGVELPSWSVSEGTLRLLALTLLGYLKTEGVTYLIEEPENGIHPRAIETILQSLQSVPGGQVFLASHSPVLLSLVKPKDLLCFARSPEGAVAIERGDRHPRLTEWKGGLNLGDLFAAGVLS